jgi:hypothetical protein
MSIFVNAAIKRALCRDAMGDRSWLEKVRMPDHAGDEAITRLTGVARRAFLSLARPLLALQGVVEQG